jgi:hypothetical protein
MTVIGRLQSITSLKIPLGDRLLYDGKRLCTRCDFQHYEVLESASSRRSSNQF